MSNHSNYIHPAERKAICAKGFGRGEDKDDACNHKWSTKVTDAVWEPCKEVKDGVLVSRQDVAEVGAVQNIFEGGQDFDPYGWSIFTGDESGLVSGITGMDVVLLTLLSRTK